MSGGPPVRRAEIRHVPAAGISVFNDPDASVAPIRELSAGYELTVVGRRPPWVHVQSGDGLDGWVDGTQLAGVATGAPPVNGHVPVPDAGGPVEAGYRVALVEKQPSSVLVATGPVVGAIGGLLAIFGAAFPWQQAVASRLEVDAFGIPVRFLTGWDQLTKGGLSIGWLIVAFIERS